MKFDKFKENDVQLLMDDEDSIEFGIDNQDDWIIFKSFINYSHPISAVVREIVSNAYDAHIDAGVDRDVEVEITERNDLTGSSDVFIVRDFGTGISPKVMKEVYSKFGKSTKRNSNNEIGAFGFGAKSPLGYNDMFEMITYVDGTEYHYAIHKGERRPKITLMSHKDTDRENGTTIKVAIKSGDAYSFRKAIESSLRYFDNITYINCNMGNNYVLIKKWGAIFRFVEGNTEKNGKRVFEPSGKSRRELDLCLGKVSYPMGSAIELSSSSNRLNGALYFDIGEIPIVWNRESVEYTKDAIATIKARYTDLQESLEDEFQKQWQQIQSFNDLYNTQYTYHNGGRWVTVHETKDNLFDVRVDNFISTESVHPKYKPLRVKPSSSLPESVVRVYKHITNGYKHTNMNGFYFEHETHEKKFFIADNDYQMPATVEAYLLHTHGDVRILKFTNNWKKSRSLILNSYANMSFTVNPYDADKELRQQYMAKAQQLYKDLHTEISKLPNVADIEVPEAFILEQKARQQEKKKRQKEKFNYMNVRQHGSFDRMKTQGSALKKRFKKSRVIYGFQTDRKLLRDIKTIVANEVSMSGRDYIHVVQISQRNERVIKEELGDMATYCKHISKLSMFTRIGNSYNLKEFGKELMRSMKHDALFTRVMEKLHYRTYDVTPNYISTSKPTLEEIHKLYAKIGNYLKYPLVSYLTYACPEKTIEEYKQDCKLHHIHPVLVTKKYLKDHEEKKTNSTEE